MSTDAITTILELTDAEAIALMAILGNVPGPAEIGDIYGALQDAGIAVSEDDDKAAMYFMASGMANNARENL